MRQPQLTVALLLLVFQNVLSTKNETNIKTIQNIDCKNIKCPSIENPVCAKLVYTNLAKVSRLMYVIMLNKCELKYAKCHKGLEAKIVPMTQCKHEEFANYYNLSVPKMEDKLLLPSTKSLAKKRSKREVQPDNPRSIKNKSNVSEKRKLSKKRNTKSASVTVKPIKRNKKKDNLVREGVMHKDPMFANTNNAKQMLNGPNAEGDMHDEAMFAKSMFGGDGDYEDNSVQRETLNRNYEEKGSGSHEYYGGGVSSSVPRENEMKLHDGAMFVQPMFCDYSNRGTKKKSKIIGSDEYSEQSESDDHAHVDDDDNNDGNNDDDDSGDSGRGTGGVGEGKMYPGKMFEEPMLAKPMHVKPMHAKPMHGKPMHAKPMFDGSDKNRETMKKSKVIGSDEYSEQSESDDHAHVDDDDNNDGNNHDDDSNDSGRGTGGVGEGKMYPGNMFEEPMLAKPMFDGSDKNRGTMKKSKVGSDEYNEQSESDGRAHVDDNNDGNDDDDDSGDSGRGTGGVGEGKMYPSKMLEEPMLAKPMHAKPMFDGSDKNREGKMYPSKMFEEPMLGGSDQNRQTMKKSKVGSDEYNEQSESDDHAHVDDNNDGKDDDDGSGDSERGTGDVGEGKMHPSKMFEEPMFGGSDKNREGKMHPSKMFEEPMFGGSDKNRDAMTMYHESSPESGLSRLEGNEPSADYNSDSLTDLSSVDGDVAKLSTGSPRATGGAGGGGKMHSGQMFTKTMFEGGGVQKIVNKLAGNAEKPDTSGLISGSGAGVTFKKPAFAEPMLAETAFAKPMLAKTAFAEPMLAETAFAEPMLAETAFAEPMLAKTAFAEPMLAETAFAEPMLAETAFAEPMLAETAFAEPMLAETAFAEPMLAETAFAEPMLAETAFAKPMFAEPMFGENKVKQKSEYYDSKSGGKGRPANTGEVKQASDETDFNEIGDKDKNLKAVDYEQYQADCPSVCPSRDVMVCTRCPHGVYKTFPSICHVRMFQCRHPKEKLELISRRPCIMSAPYYSENMNMQTQGRVTEPDDYDRVLQFIRCREKGKLGKDPKCIKMFGDNKQQKKDGVFNEDASHLLDVSAHKLDEDRLTGYDSVGDNAAAGYFSNNNQQLQRSHESVELSELKLNQPTKLNQQVDGHETVGLQEIKKIYSKSVELTELKLPGEVSETEIMRERKNDKTNGKQMMDKKSEETKSGNENNQDKSIETKPGRDSVKGKSKGNNSQKKNLKETKDLDVSYKESKQTKAGKESEKEEPKEKAKNKTKKV